MVEVDDDERQKVIQRFIQDGRLLQMPAKREKRLMVLDRIAQSFEPGRRYPELEVNEVLRGFDDDVATLRRYLVDHDFLTRENNVYWRSGGSFAV